jgi:hypothetical protein
MKNLKEEMRPEIIAEIAENYLIARYYRSQPKSKFPQCTIAQMEDRENERKYIQARNEINYLAWMIDLPNLPFGLI